MGEQAGISADELTKLLKDNFRLDISIGRKHAQYGDGSWVEARVTLSDLAGNEVLVGECEVDT